METIFDTEVNKPAENVKLRSYQKEAVEAVLNGPRRVLGFAATGLGKTTIALSLFEHFHRMLFVAPAREIVFQTAKRARQMFPSARVGVEVGGKRIEGYADIVVATWQSLVSRWDRWKDEQFGIIVFDEAHHLHPYNSSARIVREIQADKILLLTATPSRSDGAGFHHFVDELVFAFTPKWGVDNGWLVPPNAVNIVYESEITEEDAILDTIEETIAFPAIIFVSSVSQILEVVATLRRAGYAAEGVWGTQPKAERSDIMRRFDGGELDIIVAHNALVEGWDAPEARSLIITRPTDNPILYTQMIGRVLRPCIELTDEMGVEGRKEAIAKSEKPFAAIYDLLPREQPVGLITFVQFYDAAPVVERQRKRELKEEIEEKLFDIFELVATDTEKIEKVRRFVDLFTGGILEDNIWWYPIGSGVLATYVERDPLDKDMCPAVYIADTIEKKAYRVNLGGWVSRLQRPKRRRVYEYDVENPKSWIYWTIYNWAMDTRIVKYMYDEIGLRPKNPLDLDIYRKLRVAWKVFTEAERLGKFVKDDPRVG